MTPTGATRRALDALLIASVIGALGWITAEADVFVEPRAQAAALFESEGPADDRVVVLGIDESFLDAAESNSLLWEVLLSRLGGAPLIIEPGLADVGNPGVRVVDWKASFVEYIRGSGGGQTIALATDVVLGDTDERGVPDLVASDLDDGLAAVVDAVAFDELGVIPAPAVLRTVPLLAVDEADPATSRLVPSGSLAAIGVLDDTDGSISFASDSVRVGRREIPTEAGRELRVRWSRELMPGGGSVHSALQLASGELEPDAYADKVVLVGVTDPAVARPTRTSTGEFVSPIEARANVINTMLTEAYATPVSVGWTFLELVLAAFVVAWATLTLHLWWTPLPVLGAIASSAGVALWQARHGAVGDPLLVVAGVLLAFLAALGLRAARERRERRVLAERFERYVPASTAHELLRHGASHITDPRRAQATVLFVDIRDFTPTAERLEPGEVAALLDRFYDLACRAVISAGGTVMQFVGDEVLAAFGVPLSQPDHVDRALACALYLRDRRAELADNLIAAGLPPVAFGVGVHCGELLAADVGGEQRLQYSVMGDAVNVASRLCGHAGPGQVLVSAEVLERAGSRVDACSLGVLDLKGLAREIHCFALSQGETEALLQV